MLRFDRKQQNSVKQLFFNKKPNKFLKMLLLCLKCMYLLFLLKTDALNRKILFFLFYGCIIDQ